MADFATALALTVSREGPFAWNKVSGEIAAAGGVTARTLAGLGLLPADIAHDYALYLQTRDEALAAPVVAYMQSLTPGYVATVYREHYWNELRGDDIQDQDIANRLFDVEVNQGGIAVREMQQAINKLVPSAELRIDGILGPVTLRLINSIPSAELLPGFQSLVAARYREVTAANPELAGDLEGWLARLYS